MCSIYKLARSNRNNKEGKSIHISCIWISFQRLRWQELWHVPTKWIESHSWWDSHEIRWRWLTQGYKCWRIKDVWGEEIWVCVSTSNAPAIGSCNKCRFWSEWILSTDRQRWIRLHTFWTQREDLQYIWKNFQKMFCEMSRRWRLSRKNDIV